MIFITILAIIVAVFAIVAAFGKLIILIFYGSWKIFKRCKPLSKQQLVWLHTSFDYFKSLPSKKKKLFIHKAQEFLCYKTFIAKGNYNISDLDKLKIASAAAQITLGYKEGLSMTRGKILLYPKAFKSPFTKKKTLGEVSMVGIVYSMADFDFGYQDNNDGINLGLHEMAHALLLENAKRSENHKLFDDGYAVQLKQLFHKIRQEGSSFNGGLYRKYAAANFHEFFAVSVELFFEKPNDLKYQYPAVYLLMTMILKQDLAD